MGTSVFTLAQTTVTFTLTLRPPLNSLARPTLTERPEEAEAGKITSEHFCHSPRPTTVWWVHRPWSPPIPTQARHTCRQAGECPITHDD